jgi:hypothetical protein
MAACTRAAAQLSPEQYLLTGLVGEAPELDLLFFQRLCDNFTPPRAGVGPADLGRAGANAAKTTDYGGTDPPNILKERVLLVSSEFHSASKQATT